MAVETTQVQRHEAPTSINHRAPVVGASEVEIAASPDAVWEVLTAFEHWPSWNPKVRSMAVEGPVAAGSVFRWKAGPGAITSVIQLVDAPQAIAWTGRTLGIRAIASWQLEPRGRKTLVRVEESFEGLLPRLLRRSMQRTLDRSLVDGLRSVKVEVERGAPRRR
jgi:uncharacterized protein YndB with AHSA1/START domain